MGASMVLNVVIGEGRITMMSDRLRHWGVPIHSTTLGGVSKTDADALKDDVAVH